MITFIIKKWASRHPDHTFVKHTVLIFAIEVNVTSRSATIII